MSNTWPCCCRLLVQLRLVERPVDGRLPGRRRLHGAREGARHGAGRHRRRGEGLQPARPRRRRLPHRPEVDLPPQGRPPPLPLHQRRRVGARAPSRTAYICEYDPHHAPRGHRHRLLRPRHPRSPTSTSAASSPSRPRVSRRPSRRRYAGRHPRAASCSARPTSPLDVYVHRGAGAYICGEETALLEVARGQAGLAAAQAAVPGHRRPVRQAHHHQQRRDARQHPLRSSSTAGPGLRRAGRRASRAARASSASRAT